MYKRTLLGSVLFMIFVGELIVGSVSGLYTLPGIPVFLILYCLLFMLYEALAIRYKLTYHSLVPLTFGIYSVLVTGLLHGELADYITAPQNNIGTTLIRIQCSFYPVFAYYALNKLTRRDPSKVPKLKTILIASLVFILILTPSKSFGLITLVNSFKTAPVLCSIFTILGVVSIFLALRYKPKSIGLYNDKVLNTFTALLFVFCLIPVFKVFLIVLVLMPVVGIMYLSKPRFRNTQI